MKKITTEVIKYNNRGVKAVTFKKAVVDLPQYLRDMIATDKGEVTNGIHNWFKDGYHVMADAESFANADSGQSVHFGIAIFASPMELALEEIGIVTVNSKVDINNLCKDLVDTYHAMGITDWLSQGVPSGIRSIVAFRHGYMLSKQFNAELDLAIKIVDGLLIEEKSKL